MLAFPIVRHAVAVSVGIGLARVVGIAADLFDVGDDSFALFVRDRARANHLCNASVDGVSTRLCRTAVGQHLLGLRRRRQGIGQRQQRPHLLLAAAATGRIVNVKKGQFLAPWDCKNILSKIKEAAPSRDLTILCERGVSFGYNNLVVDMLGIPEMRALGAPVTIDATHAVQLPGGQGTSSGGQREFVPVLARAAIAVGVSGVFMETHPDPACAKSDGPNAVPLRRMKDLLSVLKELDALTKRSGFLENQFD